MKTVYAHISPLTNAYTNFYHLFFLKELKPRRLFICVWDLYFYEDKRFLKNEASKKDLLKQYVQNLEKTLNYLDIDYKMVYLSEARKRFLARPDLNKLFHKVIATLTFDYLQRKAKINHALIGETTFSRMNYMIIDFLVATHFHELFPELSQSTPTKYVSSLRFRVIHDHILTTLSQNYRQTASPDVEWMIKTPIVLNSKGRIPSYDMTDSQVRDIVEDFFTNNEITEKFLDDSIHMFSTVELDVPYGWKASVRKEGYNGYLKLFNPYLAALRSIVHTEKPRPSPVSLYVNSPKEFEEKVKPLNALKLQILSLCNGRRTSYEIAKELDMNPVTVSVYFGRLKKAGLISDARRPRLKVRNIVVDLTSIT